MWIKVSDRLPDKPMSVIVWHSAEQSYEICPWVVAASGEQQYFDTEDGYIDESDITHWMPIAPPTAEISGGADLQTPNTGSPQLPSMEQSFREGFESGSLHIPYRLAWQEWQHRASAR